MTKSYLYSLAILLIISSITAYAQNCNPTEFLPELVPGQSTNNGIPCGFFDPNGLWVNECSPCGAKISDDNCSNTPIGSLCELDGFQTTTNGYTNDVFTSSLGFCGGGTGTHNNFWIGFTASSNSIELLITTSNCFANGNARGIQAAIVETDCNNFFQTMSNGGQPACFGAVGQGGLFNSSTILLATNLIPGAPYYLMVDGFAGGVCDLTIDVLDGIEDLDSEMSASALFCPDILNPGAYSDQEGSGGTIFVAKGGAVSTDLTFFWLDPSGELIAETEGEVSFGVVTSNLPGSFFTEIGTYTVEVIDNSSCCPLCGTVSLEIGEPTPGAAAIITGPGGQDEIGCNSNIVTIAGSPEDGSAPSLEVWSIVDANGDRNIIAQSQNGLSEIEITREIIEEHFPNQDMGEAQVIYGFFNDLNQLCLSETVVTVAFDFTETGIGCIANEGCVINDITYDIECIGNNGEFNISLTFEHENSSGLVDIFGNGVSYGEFNIDAQPIVLTGLNVSDNDSFEFIIQDAQFGADCRNELVVDDIPCSVNPTECNVNFVEVGSFECNTDGTYGMTVDYEFTNGTANLIDISINGGSAQTFINDGSTELINITPRQNSDFDIIQVCLNGNPDCCLIIEYEQPDCEDITMFECEVNDFIITDLNCVATNEYSFNLDFEIPNPNITSFRVDVNGAFLNNFAINSLPLNLSIVADPSLDADFLTISYTLPQVECAEEFSIARPPCLFNSIDNTLLDGLEIYPNPTTEILILNQIPQEIAGLNIIDHLGRVVENFESKSQIQLDVSKYTNGVYAIQFYTTDNRILSRRFVKM